MSNDDKKYTIIGKVEIGTDEYRDLIEQKAEAENYASDYCSRYWEEQSKSKKLDKELSRLKNMLDEFMSDHPEVQTDWSMFVTRKMCNGDVDE